MSPCTLQTKYVFFYMGFILLQSSERSRIYMPELRFVWPAMEAKMFDAIMIAAGFGFFIAAIIYTVACDRL